MKSKLLIFSAILFTCCKLLYGDENFNNKNTLTENKKLSEDKQLTENKHLTEEKSLTEDKTLTEGISKSFGTYAVIVEDNNENVVSNTVATISFDTEFDTYINEYGKWLKLVIPKNQNARYQFADYFSDWQWTGESADFFSYSENRAEQERRIQLCYDAAVKKFGIGTAIVAGTCIVASILPGGSIYREAFMLIAKATAEQAIFGGASGGVISFVTEFIHGKRGNELIYDTINGAADGYLIGAITGIGSGSAKVYKLAKDAKKIANAYTFFAGNVYDSSGKLLLNAQNISKQRINELAKILGNQGDDALKALSEVANKNPKKLSNAIEWISIKGKDGIYDVIKWGGKVPNWITKETIEIARKSAASSLKATAESLSKLPSIKLSVRELDLIRKNPASLHEIVTKHTGKSFSDGYLEFFVRLSKQNPRQMEEIWNYSKAVRDFIKNEGIRAGGVHEWLMCEHFCEFLTNPKWRRDGAYLCELLSNLTQPTNSVVMENITITLKDGTKEFYPIWNHLLESQKTLGNASNPRSVIHNLTRDVVEKSNNAEELIVNLDKMVETNFTKETYASFSRTLENCLK